MSLLQSVWSATEYAFGLGLSPPKLTFEQMGLRAIVTYKISMIPAMPKPVGQAQILEISVAEGVQTIQLKLE